MSIERPLPATGQAPRITELWAWTQIDPLTDVEGVMAFKLPDGSALPLVAATEALMEQLRPTLTEQMERAELPPPALRRFVAES